MAIAVDPGLHAEAKRVWPALRDFAMAPAGEEGVMRVIAKRFTVFPQPERTDSEWSAWWDAYCDALGDLPEEALEAAMQAYVREYDAEFLPKPGRIRELAREVRTKGAIAAQRAAAAAAYDPARMDAYFNNRPMSPERSEPTPAEREQVHQMAVETSKLLAQTVARSRPPPFKFSAPKTDEHGVTPEMRELLARQNA